MPEANILGESRDQKELTLLLEDMHTLLKDSDVTREKEQVRQGLSQAARNITYLLLGDGGVGKTTLLRALFDGILPDTEEMQGSICEYRWGEETLAVPVGDGFEKRFIPAEEMRGVSLVDTRGLESLAPGARARLEKLLEQSAAVFAVFDAARVGSNRMWDLLESVPRKRMVFFLTKCDLLPREQVERNQEKLRQYMAQAGITAPVFPVSAERDGAEGCTPLAEVRRYIRAQVIGEAPILTRQKQELEEAQALLDELRGSFELRKRQYMADSLVLEKINSAMDGYVAGQARVVERFTGELTREIDQAIDQYQDEIIAKLDPAKIKERFSGKDVFMDYLNMVNDNYKARMTDSINRKAMEVIKECLHDLERVFQEAVGYFEQRESILSLNDRFYGTMVESKRQMVLESRQTCEAAGEFYQTLGAASEELFMRIWEEREKYDRRILVRGTLSKIGGAVAGGAAGAGVASALTGVGVLATASTVAAAGTPLAMIAAAPMGLVAAAAVAGLVVVGAILGAAAINKIAKTLYDPVAGRNMEKAAARCIEEFKQEVAKTRQAMTAQVLGQVTGIFQNELRSADSCFTDFRMSVNIDGRNLAALEETIRDSLERVDTLRQLTDGKEALA